MGTRSTSRTDVGPTADDGLSDPQPDPESAVRGIVLRLLTVAPRTRAQLAEALRQRGVPPESAERVLDRFAELGLIDDDAYARAWVESRHAGRGLARRALTAELRRRGVDEDVTAQAVQLIDDDVELATARALVARRLPRTIGLGRDRRLRRLAGLLTRKGYSPGLAERVVREAIAAEVDGAQEAAQVARRRSVEDC